MIDFEKIEDALHAWAEQATGVKVIWSEQNGPQIKAPYCTLRLTGPVRVGADPVSAEYRPGNPDGEEIELTVRGQRELSLSLQSFTETTLGNSSARALASRAQTSLSKPTVLHELRSAGLAVVEVGEVQNINAVLATDWQGRATFDVRLRTCDVEVERTTYIETVELSRKKE